MNIDQNISPEQEASFKDALLTAANMMEKARCLESEHEASMLMASSMLQHPPVEPTLDVTTLPGGVQDAWTVLSEATKTGKTPASALIDSLVKKEATDLPMGSGQLAKAAHMSALNGCLQRSTAISQEFTTRRPKDGATFQKALQTLQKNPGPHLWLKTFDERFKEIKTYHARHDQVERVTKRVKWGNPATDGYDLASIVSEQMAPIQDGTLFNAEEVMGKYLYFHYMYESSVVPIKHVFMSDAESSFGLGEFLSVLSRGLESIPEEPKLKERKKYARFLMTLESYLEGFLKRTQPLLKLDDVTAPAHKEFVDGWRKTGGAAGWEAKLAEASMVDSSTNDDSEIDLSPYSSAEELAKAVGGDQLKAELSRLGLKCGGTPNDRAKRLFMTKDTPLDKLPKKLFAKKAADGDSSATLSVKNESRVDIARREATVMALLNQLRPTLEATMRRTERRDAQTPHEREKEVEEDLHGSDVKGAKEKKEGDDSDDDDEDAPIYNPKGVPLGWDGKPIPYWLFKLHGLNHFYPCEICGNESYRGRRNFETHFAEAKHSFGMKSLGIPNTKHFHGVTKIEDAQKLWNKLKDMLHHEQFDGHKDEEYEDSHGNVLSRSTYEDLARQGLL